jgi:hypothetical protein
MTTENNPSEEGEKKYIETSRTVVTGHEHEEKTTDISNAAESELGKITSLLSNESEELRSRWTSIQAQFVDQPCTSIEQADALIADAIERLSKALGIQQSQLRERWLNHDDVSTEELRLTLQEYRTFLNNLFS